MPKFKLTKADPSRYHRISAIFTELLYEADLGVLKESAADWVARLNANFKSRGDLTSRELEVLTDIYEEVFNASFTLEEEPGETGEASG